MRDGRKAIVKGTWKNGLLSGEVAIRIVNHQFTSETGKSTANVSPKALAKTVEAMFQGSFVKGKAKGEA